MLTLILTVALVLALAEIVHHHHAIAREAR